MEGLRNHLRIYDHRERLLLSAKIYYENERLVRIDINRRATVSVKKKSDGTEYIVLTDTPEKSEINYALKDFPEDTDAA